MSAHPRVAWPNQSPVSRHEIEIPPIPAMASASQPYGFTMGQELQSTAAMDPRTRELKGFHEFLIGRLGYLSPEMRRSLAITFDELGWPSHLRSMENASWQLEPGMPWDPEDYEMLKALPAHGVMIGDIANIFFEGRTVDECQAKLDILKAGMPIAPAEETTDHTEIVTEQPSKGPTLKSALPLLVQSGIPSASAQTTATPIKERRADVPSLSAARARSNTPYTDSRKDWDQADRDIVWNAAQKGLTPRQIHTQHLPFRSESAIQTRISVERKLRGVQATPTKWSNKDNALLLKLRGQGHSFESIAPHLSRERTPQHIRARYHKLKKQAEENSVEDEEDEENGEDVQVDAGGDDSDYAEGTPPAALRIPSKPKTARKTITSNSTPKTLTKSLPSIASIRTKLLNSIDLPTGNKKELRKALGRASWPTRFKSIEDYKSPLPKNGARWTEQDTKALACIRRVVPTLPYKLVCEFFPGRSETSIRHQYNTKINPSPKK